MMSIPHCAGCRHWAPGQSGGRGVCGLIVARSGLLRGPVIALSEYLETCVVSLVTPPDFGCTLHEPIAPPVAPVDPSTETAL